MHSIHVVWRQALEKSVSENLIRENLWESSYFPKLANGRRKKFNMYTKTREECETLLPKIIAKAKAEIQKAKAKRKASQSA